MRAIEEPELPGPLLRPVLPDAPGRRPEGGPRTCPRAPGGGARDLPCHRRAVLRSRRSCACGRPPGDSGQAESAAGDYEAAVRLADGDRAPRMLELRALTEWARLAGCPRHVRAELRACVGDVAAGGPSRSLDEARKRGCRHERDQTGRRVPRQPAHPGRPGRRSRRRRALPGTADATSAFRALVCPAQRESPIPIWPPSLQARTTRPTGSRPGPGGGRTGAVRPLGLPRVHRLCTPPPSRPPTPAGAACRSSA